ncbi:MAG: hypothetical protein OIF32_06410, partial [Campylobacterales bacterium]|nr:hypothetical protein [Campylobacterales bacterium]
RMQFHKIYLSESSISILFENIFSELDEKNSVLIPKILTLSNSNSLKSYILALIYLNEKNRNTSYILAFDKLEKKYKNLLLSYYERDEELTTGEKIFYDLEKMDKQR